jgi:hypothetical protein
LLLLLLLQLLRVDCWLIWREEPSKEKDEGKNKTHELVAPPWYVVPHRLCCLLVANQWVGRETKQLGGVRLRPAERHMEGNHVEARDEGQLVVSNGLSIMACEGMIF